VTVKRIYVGEESRYYPTLAVEAEPGDEVEFGHADDVPDDGRWETASAAKKQDKRSAESDVTEENA